MRSFTWLFLFLDNSKGLSRSRPTCSAPGLAHGAHLAAAGTAAVEDTGPVGFQAGHGDARGHFEALEDFASFRIDTADFALLGFQGGVPEFAIDPGDTRNETI